MIRLYPGLLAFLLALSPSASSGRSGPAAPQLERITTLDGLSQDIVTCLYRDRFGFLWIGTEDGLNEYDGYSIRVYKHVPGDSSTLSSNWIQGICEFGDEDLLITTGHGFSVYHRAADGFLRAPQLSPGGLEQFSGTPVRDARGNYWILTLDGTLRIGSPDLRHFFSPDLGLPAGDFHFTALALDAQGRVLAGADSLLLIFNRDGGAPQRIALHDASLPHGRFISVTSVTERTPGTYWIGTHNGLYRYELRSGELALISLDTGAQAPGKFRDMVFGMQWDHSGRLWIAGFGGLYCYIPDQQRAVAYHMLGSGAPSRVYALLIDPTEILWAGTWNEGLFKKNLRNDRFGLLRESPQTPLAGGSSKISAIFEDPQGELWLGSQDGGVTVADPSLRRFRALPASPGDPDALSGTTVSAITGDDAGNIWIASSYATVDWYNIRSKKMRHIHLPAARGSPVSVLAMFIDRQGILWLGTEAFGIFRYDTRGLRFLGGGEAGADTLSRKITAAWSFTPGGGDTLWIGGWVGNTSLHRLATATGGLQSYPQPELSSARAMIRGTGGRVWIGSWGHGLTRFDPSSGEIKNYSEQNGLPSNYVKSLLRDDRGTFWIGTERGLSRFDPQSETFRNYDISDGLQGNFFYSGSCLRSRSGRLFFGGSNGLNAFIPDSIRDAEYAAPVILTSFRIFDRRQFFAHPLCTTAEIELSHDDNLFAFEYVSIDYRAPARLRYEYRMEGFNDDWIQAGARRYVSYTHLDPGAYTFNVRGTNSDGVWNPTPAAVRIVILPAFWQTWWFRVSLAAIVAGLLYLLYRYRLGKLLELERTRAAIATDLHDDIGTSLTNIALFSDLAQRDIAAGSTLAGQRLEKISSTARSLLDGINDIVWSIKPENDDLEQTILRMEDYAVEMLEENGIDLHVEIPEQLRGLKLPMAVRKNLFLVFKEVISNILKHAAATHVDVMISLSGERRRDRRLLLVIADNGKGFDPASRSQGNGLRNIELRARHLGGSMALSSGEARGTSVEISVPLKSPI